MKLSEIAKAPKLIKIVLDKEKIVEEYGEPLEFFIYDRQPLEVFGRLANAEKENFSEIADLMKDLILDEEGNPVMSEDKQLPFDIVVATMGEVSQTPGEVTNHAVRPGDSDTNFILLLDTLATRYSKLPSQIVREGDSFDLMVMDVALTYEKYQQRQRRRRY